MNVRDKQCYTDYVKRALCFYSRYPNKTNFRNYVDKSNWYACHTVLKSYSDRDKDMLTYVYGAFDTVADNVYAMANKYHIHQNEIWSMMGELEKKVAIERGLWV